MKLTYQIVMLALLLPAEGFAGGAQSSPDKMTARLDLNEDRTGDVSTIAYSAGYTRRTGKWISVRTGDALLEKGTGPGQDAILLDQARLESGEHRNKGLILGAGIGFVAGATVGYLGQRWACGFSEDDDCRISKPMVIGFGVIGAIPGAIIGVVLGSREPSFEWTDPARTRIHLSERGWSLARLFYF